jgi:hypothetical protein
MLGVPTAFIREARGTRLAWRSRGAEPIVLESQATSALISVSEDARDKRQTVERDHASMTVDLTKPSQADPRVFLAAMFDV